ncbi:MAG: class I SAM-dependent methyltransferase [Bacilli bacterium]|nr:class I SAM-dependent methyltransferase [Bacilli bacterium]
MTSALHKRYLKEMEDYAEYYRVPIIQKDSIDYLKKFLKRHEIKSVLEIGTGIGYTTINMALDSGKMAITSIENDEKLYLEAIKNIKKFFFEDKITLIFNDPLNVRFDKTFDVIFIDAAKGQYMNYFNHFQQYLKDDGVIISDNIDFRLLKQKKNKSQDEKETKIINKIKDYVSFLEEQPKYISQFVEVGDGLVITKKQLDNDN